MKLYNYFRSSASFRVRIALELKGLGYDYVPVHLVKGEHRQAAYSALAPEMLVPHLELDGHNLAQSMAIIEYLDETPPEPPLLPRDAVGRAQVRALAQSIACEIHPLNNLRVLKAIRSEFNADQAAVDAWAAGWIAPGFDALEALVGRHGAGWSFGDAPTLVDCYLIPQMYSARRFNIDLSPWPRLLAVEQIALAHPAFASAHPDLQPDADA